jgi:alpha-ribazole phosphatase
MKLILVRHPPPLVEQGVCYGRSDLDVAPAQLAATLAALSRSLPRGVPVYSSPLRRCAKLATPLALALAAPAPMLDVRLVEMDFGRWEMQRWDEIDRLAVDAWAADLLHYRPGDGESVMQVAERVARFLDDVKHEPHGAAIVVCHAGTMRLLSAFQAGLSLTETALRAAHTPHDIPYGATLILQF